MRIRKEGEVIEKKKKGKTSLSLFSLNFLCFDKRQQITSVGHQGGKTDGGC